MVWQVSVIGSKTKTIMVTVPENCTGAELFTIIKEHPDTPNDVDLIFMTRNGEIENSSTKRLQDYDVADKGAVYLTMRLPGGVWPTLYDLQETPRSLKATEGMQITTSAEHPDIFDFEDGMTPRVIMSCGHAAAPLSLAMFCLYELEKFKDSINCPVCTAVWKFSQVFDAACLSDNERLEFERRALLNKMSQKTEEINSCPKCDFPSSRLDTGNKRVLCINCTRRSGKKYEFCWMCLREWKAKGTDKCGYNNCNTTNEVLTKCKEKQIGDVACPSRRGCPHCFAIIEHKEGCRHMTCCDCKYEFCFICLRKHPCDAGLWGYFFPCKIASRQRL